MVILDDRDIVNGSMPGGANTSGSMLLPMLQSLLAAVPAAAPASEYERVSIENNVLGRETYEGRRRSFRALREMYLLDPDRLLFRALRDLWSQDPASQPILAGLELLARDSVFRATAARVLQAREGEVVTSADLASVLLERFPTYSRASAAKIGRNTSASWSQTGHLVGRTDKARVHVQASPATFAFAAFLGYLQGLRGEFIFDSIWMDFLDLPAGDRGGMAQESARRGYIEYRAGGNVVEVGFRHLGRPLEGGSA